MFLPFVEFATHPCEAGSSSIRTDAGAGEFGELVEGFRCLVEVADFQRRVAEKLHGEYLSRHKRGKLPREIARFLKAMPGECALRLGGETARIEICRRRFQ